jgi:hypothetical protein
MTTGPSNLEHRASVSGHPDQVARNHPRASKLFGQDHAYAARLVQIATAIRGAVRSTMMPKPQDQAASEIQEDDGIASGIVREPRADGSGP